MFSLPCGAARATDPVAADADRALRREPGRKSDQERDLALPRVCTRKPIGRHGLSGFTRPGFELVRHGPPDPPVRPGPAAGFVRFGTLA